MPEFLNFLENFRQIIVNRGSIPDKLFEKREARDATNMLSSFLYNVLVDNQGIILRYENLKEMATEESLKQ